MLMRYFFLLFLTATALAEGDPVQALTEKELQTYQFSNPAKITQVTVKELNVGQQFTLDKDRREFTNLLHRQLGIRQLSGDRSDLKSIQQVIDKKILTADQVREWQSVGVVFGDILSKEFGLSWISYEDEMGVSKALRWRSTENYVFPITLFSKRIRFKQKIDVYEVYDKLHGEINVFKQLPAPVAGARSTR